jgi:ATP-dependent DNA helicase RecQ
MVEHLEAEGYLHTDPEHGALLPTAQAGDVLFRGKAVQMRVRKSQVQNTTAPGGHGPRTAASIPADAPLFNALKEVRYRLARAEGVPAFIIFSNATLVDMADRRPRTTAEFLTVSGVGQTKAQRYAEPFLEAIRAFQSEVDFPTQKA